MLDRDFEDRRVTKYIIALALCGILTTALFIAVVAQVTLANTRAQFQTSSQRQVPAPGACSSTFFSVTKHADPPSGLPQDPSAYTLLETGNHFASSEVKYLDPLNTFHGCIDGREGTATFGTPGGDISEFIMALAVYLNETKTPVTREVVASYIKNFMADVITPERPFYFHSDSDKMMAFLQNISAQAGVRVTIFPDSIPAVLDPQIWLDTFTEYAHQGCGHVRLTLSNPVFYGLAGLETVPKLVVQEIVRWFWLAPPDQKRKFDIRLVSGPLGPKSIALVEGNCGSAKAVYPPQYHGSSVFIVTDSSSKLLRQKVMVPFFTVDRKVPASLFYSKLDALAQVQLMASLHNLTQAKTLPLYVVTLTNQP